MSVLVYFERKACRFRKRGEVIMNKPPKTLTHTQTGQLLKQLQWKDGRKCDQHKPLRNYTMTLLMLEAGLRVGEVVRLHTSDLIYNDSPVTSLFVQPEIAKNKKPRTIPMTARLIEAIEAMNKRWWKRAGGVVPPFAFYDKPPCLG